MKTDLELIRTLTDLPGVSGHEDPIIGFVRHRFERSSDDVTVDGIGNVIARAGRPGGPRVMMFAHLDQIGFCIKRLGDDGFVRIDRIGGVNRKALVAAPVWLHTDAGEAVPGSIGVMAHHLTPDAQRFTVPDLPDLYVDVGAGSREELVAMGLKVGDPISFHNPFQLLNGRFLRAAALDDRIGVYILLKTFEALAARDDLPCDLYAVATVQEEFNVRGSEPAARAIAPDLAICIDGSLAGDTPDLRGVNDIRLGGGPSMSLMTFHGRGTLGGLVPNPKLVRHFDATAEALGIPLQRGASTGGLTDASFLQLLHHGIAAIDVGVPMRYSHSPVEMVCLDDVERAIELFAEAVARIDASLDLSRGTPWHA
jgi:putative aminopeptidase FrvX